MIIFTDGSSRGNPGPGGWGAVLIETADKAEQDLHKIGDNHAKVREFGAGDPMTTNNRMELTAAIEALNHVVNDERLPEQITIFSDSEYMIKGITQWIAGWKRKGWIGSNRKEVLNRDLWTRLDDVVMRLSTKSTIYWKHIDGHAGIVGNERCDTIATSFADHSGTKLFCGNITDYLTRIIR